MSGKLEFVQLLRTASAEANLPIDLPGSLAHEALLGRHETGVPRQVLAVPAAVFVWHRIKSTVGCPRSLRHCFSQSN